MLLCYQTKKADLTVVQEKTLLITYHRIRETGLIESWLKKLLSQYYIRNILLGFHENRCFSEGTENVELITRKDLPAVITYRADAKHA